MTAIRLRSATSADSQFCYTLHRAASGPSVRALWGWDEATQVAHHEHSFDPARTQIITLDGQDVGSLTLDYQPTQIYLERIEIHPRHQGHGVGSQLIHALQIEAGRRRQPIVLDVLVTNHRARALYLRLGFQEIARHGPNNVKIRMRCIHPLRPT